MFSLRQPLHQPPEVFQAVPHRAKPILFFHPAFDSEELFVLGALDLVSPDSWGVYHRTALDACQIIANNEHGYLSTTRDASGRVDDSETVKVLSGRKYFYIVECKSTPDTAYPIVKSFDAWTFPGTIPSHWSSVVDPVEIPSPLWPTPEGFTPMHMAMEVMNRDKRCILTGYDSGVYLSHHLIDALADPLMKDCIIAIWYRKPTPHGTTKTR